MRTSIPEAIKVYGSFERILGISSGTERLRKQIKKVARYPVSVLITGESGTGKELVARALHELSGRTGLFIPVNSSSLGSELADSELFGHYRGAFTGASERRQGLIREAEGGTLFFDEVGDMPLPTQAKILRFMDHGEVRAVGSDQYLNIKTRIIAATNRPISSLREDLFYRLQDYHIDVLPLRKRHADVQHLINHLGHDLVFDQESMDLMLAYPWPGNIRELLSAINHIRIVSDGETVTPEHLPSRIIVSPIMEEFQDNIKVREESLGEESSLRARLRKIETEAIFKAIDLCKGNIQAASDMLKIKRTTLMAKMRRLRIENRWRV